MVKRHWKDPKNDTSKIDLSELRKGMISKNTIIPKKPIVIDPMDKHRERIKELRKRLDELVDRGI